MKLYNSLTNKKEQFTPIDGQNVKIYSCGQTIQREMHIGNARTYSYWDVLVRYLKWRGYNVYWIMNITDVGHLTDDADEGEDKIIESARAKNMEPMVFIEKQIQDFFRDIDSLKIQRADIYPRATGHINEMIYFIQKLLDKGFAYISNGSVYFAVDKFPNYGGLSESSKKDDSAGIRIIVNPEKKNPRDFALWINAPKEHLMKWQSPFSVGYPGWHIECSTMALKYFGETLDIHTGGIEHRSLHHINEIAQAEAITGKKFVNYWLHANHLTLNGEKMSKSIGNTITVKEFISQYGYLTSRILLINSHYRKAVDFNEKTITQAKNINTKLANILNKLDIVEGGNNENLKDLLTEMETQFKISIDDDLNTVGALQSIIRFVNELPNNFNNRKNLLIKSKNKILELLKILGIDYSNEITLKQDIKPFIDTLLEIRKELRSKKEFSLADNIRSKLKELGIVIEDKNDNCYWYIDGFR